MTEDEERVLPTRQDLFKFAAAELETANDRTTAAEEHLQSEWRPIGSPLSERQTEVRAQVKELLLEIRGRMDHADQLLNEAAHDSSEYAPPSPGAAGSARPVTGPASRIRRLRGRIPRSCAEVGRG